MKRPMFVITETQLNYGCTNKAQEWAVNHLKGFLHETMSDRQALEKFHDYLEEVAQKAHELFPRCKQIIVTCNKDISHSDCYIFKMNCDTTDHLFVARFSVSPILDEWKGGSL